MYKVRDLTLDVQRLDATFDHLTQMTADLKNAEYLNIFHRNAENWYGEFLSINLNKQYRCLLFRRELKQEIFPWICISHLCLAELSGTKLVPFQMLHPGFNSVSSLD
jgi:hypothetical protein